MSKRTFIAIHIRPEEELLKFIRALHGKLSKSRINWVNPETMHLTLRFLGNTTKEQIGKILKEAPGIFNQRTPFDAVLKGFGKFGSTESPKVLWIGLEGNEALSELATETELMVQSAGFEGEERAFRPHLTLGRIKWLKEAENLKEMLDDYREVVFHQIVVNEVVFYESILKPAGPVYRPIQKFSLKG